MHSPFMIKFVSNKKKEQKQSKYLFDSTKSQKKKMLMFSRTNPKKKVFFKRKNTLRTMRKLSRNYFSADFIIHAIPIDALCQFIFLM